MSISKNTAPKKYFAYDQFNADVHFLLFFSSSKNDVTKNLKKVCETGICDPFTTIFDLIIPKQQESQKSVCGVLQGQNIWLTCSGFWCFPQYLPVMTSQISLKISKDEKKIYTGKK